MQPFSTNFRGSVELLTLNNVVLQYAWHAWHLLSTDIAGESTVNLDISTSLQRKCLRVHLNTKTVSWFLWKIRRARRQHFHLMTLDCELCSLIRKWSGFIFTLYMLNAANKNTFASFTFVWRQKLLERWLEHICSTFPCHLIHYTSFTLSLYFHLLPFTNATASTVISSILLPFIWLLL